MQHSNRHPHPHAGGNNSVSSLVSSSNSSAVSSILPRGSISASSQSDVASDNISLSSTNPDPPHSLRGPYHDQEMGQAYSTPSTPPPPPSPLIKSSMLSSTGSKLKRAFAGRRKNHTPSRSPSPSIIPHPSPVSSLSSSSRSALGAKLHLPSNVFGRKSSSSSSSPVSEPPIPPPKLLSPKRSIDKPLPVLAYPHDLHDNPHNSIMPVTPGMTSALDYIRLNEQEQITTSPPPPPTERPSVDTAKSEPIASAPQKEIWRKSDSTMSHRTVRPGAAGGNRTPRPVSMAESLHSNHTVVPINKRLSALLTDTDLAPPEEADPVTDRVTGHAPRRAFSSSSLKSNNRLSTSLTFGAHLSTTKSHTQPISRKEFKFKSASEGPSMSPAVSNQSSTLRRAGANEIAAPLSHGSQPVSGNIKGRLTAWTNASPVARRPSHSSRRLPQTPQPTSGGHHPSFRNTAISITSSFSPAAGFARRAVERMGKAWGGMHSSHTSVSSTAPSAFPGTLDLGRVSSRQSNVSPVPSKSKRRTPNAPSGAWSISSSTTSSSRSTSESDIFSMSSGPSLRTCLRGSFDNSGLIFGKPLHMAVRAAGPAPRPSGHPIPQAIASRPELVQLEDRKLSALVVRCAQHLMVWGVQEEGLFRVNGRPYHISKLRTEFDSGADYELVECDLGDVDPHAVASVFKAYLRELPEPVLTRNLTPFFEAAIQAEQNENSLESSSASSTELMTRGPSLPTNPRNGELPLRKPPSLSTLAMPKLSAMRPPSQKLLGTLAALIDKLPEENRDLLLTITELIKATARESKETRMPLSNLLLVFCPSLNMNPPLLRALCEGEGIWNGRPVFDIKRDTILLDIRDEMSSDRDDHSVQLPSLVGDSASSSSSFVNVSLRSPSEASVDQPWPIQDGSLPCSSSDSLSTPAKKAQIKVDFPVVSPESPRKPIAATGSRRLRPKPENLVQFPSYAQPAAPVLTTRKSLTSLSLPSFGIKSDQNSPEPASPSTSSLRVKLRHRPSFQYLTSKRSSSALKSAIFPPISAPLPACSRSESDSNSSSPISTHDYTLPSIEPSSWTFNIEDHQPQPLDPRQDSPSPSSPATFAGTPSVDIYQTPAGSLISLDMSVTSAPAMQRSQSASSDDSFCSLSPTQVDFIEAEDAEWTRSVLLAADMNALGRDP